MESISRGRSDGHVFLDELAEALAVFVFHVNEFDAVAVGADVANDSGEMDLAETGANFELDGIAGAEAIRGFDISATQADGFHSSHAHLWTADLRTQRRFQRDAGIAAGHDKIPENRSSRFVGGACTGRAGTLFHQSESVFRGGTKPTGFTEGQAFTLARKLAEQVDGFEGTQTAQSFDGFNANELVAQSFVFAGGNFHEQGNGGGFLTDTDLIDHHRNDEGMRILENSGENEGGALRRRRVRRAGEFADGKILEVPFPTGQGARESAQ